MLEGAVAARGSAAVRPPGCARRASSRTHRRRAARGSCAPGRRALPACEASPRSASSDGVPRRVARSAGRARRRPGRSPPRRCTARCWPARAPRRSRRRRSGRRRGRRARGRDETRARSGAALARGAATHAADRGKHGATVATARSWHATCRGTRRDAARSAADPAQRPGRGSAASAAAASQRTSMRTRTRMSTRASSGAKARPNSEARDHVDDVERQRGGGDGRAARQACGWRRCVHVYTFMISFAARAETAQASASATRPRRLPVRRAERGAGEPDQPPGGHLPRRIGALAEHDVRGEHPERADGEAGQRPERVADDERDRGDRLDVGQRDERVASQRGDGGERRHDGEPSAPEGRERS